MCGISGIFNYSNKSVNYRQVIDGLVEIQSKRGPDDSGVWISDCKKILFGHNRLSIIDLSKSGSQPMVSHDKRYVITFNGEIYNYKEIKTVLINLGVKFKSNTDTEVLIESYKYWGIEFLNKVRGMYAFAIWDTVKKNLFLARDPFGIKPLYYTNKDNVYYFASEVKAIISIKSLSFKKSLKGLMNFYKWGNMQDPYTMFENIYSLEAGSYKIIDYEGNVKNGKFANIKSAIINSKRIDINNEIDASLYLKDIIDESVKYHQVSDVPITLLLSSGADSSVIASSIEDKTNCNALTLDFKNTEINTNEKYLAEKTAMMNNLKHYVENIDDQEINLLLSKFFYNMDLPTNDGLNVYFASYLAKKIKSKVIISGVGGDELFSGYPSFKRIPIINKIFTKIPYKKSINKILKNYLYSFSKKSNLNPKYSDLYSHGKNLEKTFFLQRSLFIENEIKEIFSDKIFREELSNVNLHKDLSEDIKNINNPNLEIMYLEIKYYLKNKLLRDADWTSMSNSIELRTPFVDWTLFQKLIPLLKTNIKVNKKLLLSAYKDKLPKAIFNRKKTGFSVPYKTLLKKFFNKNVSYNKSIKDWSLLSIKKYSNINNLTKQNN